jgi:hypothetical protein
MKEGDEVDYTAKPAGGVVRGQKVKTCPKCGRSGLVEKVQFKTGAKLMVTHKKTYMGVYWRVTDSCIAPAPAESQT